MNKIDFLTDCLAETPDDPFLHFALAQEYAKLGDLQAARVRYTLLLQEHPDYIATYYHLGKCLERLGLIGEAMSIYRSGIGKARAEGDFHAAAELSHALHLLEEE